MEILNRPIINRYMRNYTSYSNLKLNNKIIIPKIYHAPFANMICITNKPSLLCYYNIKENKLHQVNIYHNPYKIVVSSIYVAYNTGDQYVQQSNG